MVNGYNIFYTDDDKDDRDIFRTAVEDIGQELSLFTQKNGDELLHAMENPPPQPTLIFLDINMPIKNGYQVLTEIRASEKNRHTPVVIFSTSNDDQAINRSRELGANLYFSKPESYEALKKAIRHIVSINWSDFKPDNFVYRAN